MSEENIQADSRRHRVQRLKKTIILMLVISITIPIVLSVVLLAQTIYLTKSVEALTQQVDRLTWTVVEQQEQLDELKRQLNNLQLPTAVSGEGTAATGEAHNESEGKGLAPNELANENVAQDSVQESQISAAEDTLQTLVDDGQQEMRKVYLTFDDGPSMYTQDILDILERYDVKATFFVLGKESEEDKEALRRIVQEGHTLGMHSYSHKYSEIYASEENFSKDLEKLQSYLYEVTGVESVYYRFPGGSSNTVSNVDMKDLADCLAEQGISFYDWNISSEDGSGKVLTVEQLVENSTANIEKYQVSVILFHDAADKRTTVEALPIIIENILAMEDTVILPITEETLPVQHIKWQSEDAESRTNE